MDDVKRFELGECYTLGGYSKMLQCPDGEYVEFDDHAAIVSGMRAAIKTHNRTIAKLEKSRDGMRAMCSALHDAAQAAGMEPGEDVTGLPRIVGELRAEVEALRKDADLGREIQRAAAELPEGWEIRVCVERGAGWVELTGQDGEGVAETWGGWETLAIEISGAIDAALEASR